MRWLILGCGYTGEYLANELLSQNISVAGTSRDLAKLERLKDQGMMTHIFDGLSISEKLEEELQEVTHIVQSIAPSNGIDPFLNLISDGFQTRLPKLEWAGYFSTVGVYGDFSGDWIDESMTPKPQKPRSAVRLEVENQWLSHGERFGFNTAILRLGGIYGPGRNSFCQLQTGQARVILKQGQYFNRVRVEDIVGATLFLAKKSAQGLFNVVDSEPSGAEALVLEAARLMKVAPPVAQNFEEAELSPMAQSFYGESKRVSNQKLLDLGYELKYPNYKSSLKQLWQSGEWETSERQRA